MNLFKYHIIVKQQLLRSVKITAGALLLLLMLFAETALGSYGYLKTEEDDDFLIVASVKDRAFDVPFYGLTVGDCYRVISRDNAKWLWGGSDIFVGTIPPDNLSNGVLQGIQIPANISVGVYEFDVQIGISMGQSVCYSDVVALKVKITGAGENQADTICSGQELVYMPECVATGMSGAEYFGWTRASVAGIKEPARTGNGGIREVLTNETMVPVEVRYVYSVAANPCCDEVVYEVVVTVMPVIRFEIVNLAPEVCSGDMTNIELFPANINYHWAMEEDEERSGFGNTIRETLHSETVASVVTYRVRPENGMCSDEQSVEVKVNQLPEVHIVNSLLQRQVSISQKLEFAVDPTYYDEYKFTYNGEEKVQKESTFVCYDWEENKRNILSVRVASSEGCENMDSLEFLGPGRNLPNSITPNGDGFNEKLLEGYDLEVFNRNGSQLYKGKNGWNGKYRGERVESGTYLYVVRLPQEDGSVLVKRYYVYVNNKL